MKEEQRNRPLDLVLAKGDGDSDLGVTTKVERNGCVLYILNVELAGLEQLGYGA